MMQEIWHIEKRNPISPFEIHIGNPALRQHPGTVYEVGRLTKSAEPACKYNHNQAAEQNCYQGPYKGFQKNRLRNSWCA